MRVRVIEPVGSPESPAPEPVKPTKKAAKPVEAEKE